jgi:hypothetical protein
MFSLLKWILLLLGLAALAYFAFFVPLGDRTLYRHLVGISATDEAQELKDELSKKAQGVKEDVTSKLPTLRPPEEPRGSSGKAGGAPLSEQSEKDKRALDELLKRAKDAAEEK